MLKKGLEEQLGGCLWGGDQAGQHPQEKPELSFEARLQEKGQHRGPGLKLTILE